MESWVAQDINFSGGGGVPIYMQIVSKFFSIYLNPFRTTLILLWWLFEGDDRNSI